MNYKLWILLPFFMLLVHAVFAQSENTRAVGRVSVEDFAMAGVGLFDPSESRGVFIGVNEFTSTFGNKPGDLKSCVNDAVDLAAAFCRLGLIEPKGVTLILSGKAGKQDSLESLNWLIEKGATVINDSSRASIDRQITKNTGEVTDEGIFFLTFSSHGFETGRIQYLAPGDMYYTKENPSTGELQYRALSEAMINETIKNKRVKRAIVLFDACRESKQMAPGMPELISAAKGMVTLYAVTSGELALDGNNNGQFTQKVLNALTSEMPPEDLKGSDEGYITVRTLMEYLNTSGHYEEAEILDMPLCRHPGLYVHIEQCRQAVDCYQKAKIIDTKASRNRRYLSRISVSDVEEALESSVGQQLLEEIEYYLDSEDKRKSYRNRDGFADAYRELMNAQDPSKPAPQVAEPTPGNSESGLAAIPPQSGGESETGTDLTSVLPKPGKPGINLIRKPDKTITREEAEKGVPFSWQVTGENVYGVKYNYRLDDREMVKNSRRAFVTLRNLEPGKNHTFQVMAVTRSGESEPVIYTFEIEGNEPPVVRFVTAPDDGEKVTGKTVRVCLEGDDPDGELSHYMLVLDDPDDPELVFENKTGEFLLKEDVLGDGPHRLIAQVIDDAGAESKPVIRDFSFRYQVATPTVKPTPTQKPTATSKPEVAEKPASTPQPSPTVKPDISNVPSRPEVVTTQTPPIPDDVPSIHIEVTIEGESVPAEISDGVKTWEAPATIALKPGEKYRFSVTKQHSSGNKQGARGFYRYTLKGEANWIGKRESPVRFSSIIESEGLKCVLVNDKMTVIDIDSELSSVHIPSSIVGHDIVSIDDSAVSYLSNVTSFDVSPAQKMYMSIDGVLFTKDGVRLIRYPQAKSSYSYNIPISVRMIDTEAFSGCDFYELDIPDNVTEVGNEIIWGCENLSRVHIGKGLNSIGDDSFGGCNQLYSINIVSENLSYMSRDGVLFTKDGTTLIKYPEAKEETLYTIPEGVTNVGNKAFVSKYLESIYMPESLVSIGDNAFRCYLIKSLRIPESVVSIGDEAFEGMMFESLTLPGSVTSLGHDVFARCWELEVIAVAEDNPVYMAIDGVLFDRSCNKLIYYPTARKEKKYIVPDSVRIIGKGAFCSSSLKSLVLSDSVISIEDEAFSGCRSLSDVKIGANVQTIGDFAFSSCGLNEVVLPESVTHVGDSAFSNTKIKSIVIPGSISNIGDLGFRYSASLEKVVIEHGVESINSDAFSYCYNLKEIVIPGSVSLIGDLTFYNCEGLRKLTIQEGVQKIGRSAFSGCGKISSVTIPGSVISIGEYAFFECSGLKSVTIQEGVQIIEQGAFDGCTNLKKVKIPDSVTFIGEWAFSGCEKLSEVELPEGVHVDENAFFRTPLEDKFTLVEEVIEEDE